jgi:hypothetical protein
LGPLTQLVGCLWLIVGGLWLTGDQIYSLAMSRPFESYNLAGGLVLFVGGLIVGGFILRKLDSQVPTIEED